MAKIDQKELQRQFRVLGQTLTMHNVLVARYSLLSGTLDIALIACAVVFCATTFVSDSFFNSIGLTPSVVRLGLGIVSVVAFFASIVSLRVDWKAKEASHKDAARKIGAELRHYRGLRDGTGKWPAIKSIELNERYWQVMDNIVPIPDKLFAVLKAKHLRKVAVSKLLDDYPGFPVFVLRLKLFFASARNFKRNRKVQDQS